MARTKRNKTELARDRALTASLHLGGYSQQAITAHLNERSGVGYTLTRQQVSYDLRQIQSQWLQSGLEDIGEARARELAKINNLEREYWQAWRDSRGENVTTTEKTATAGAVETTKQIRELNGDPRFLEGIRWCIDKRCRMFGLDAPEKLEWYLDKDPADMTEEEIDAALGEIEKQKAIH